MIALAMISLIILAREIHRPTRKNDAAIFSGRHTHNLTPSLNLRVVNL